MANRSDYKTREVWMIEGATQYKTFVLDKASYVGYDRAFEYPAEGFVDTTLICTQEARKRHEREIKEKRIKNPIQIDIAAVAYCEREKKAKENLIKKLCKKYSVKLIDIAKDEKDKSIREFYKDKSCTTGDKIVLGIYSNPELKLASFFHELGHNKAKAVSKYTEEVLAWKIGFKMARDNGISFSDKTIRWCKEQGDSYKYWEWRECRTPWYKKILYPIIDFMCSFGGKDFK